MTAQHANPPSDSDGIVDTPTEWINWLRAAAIRAVKTAAQAALGALGAATAIGEADWRLIAGTAGLGAIASLLTSLVGLPEANNGKSIAAIGK